MHTLDWFLARESDDHTGALVPDFTSNRDVWWNLISSDGKLLECFYERPRPRFQKSLCCICFVDNCAVKYQCSACAKYTCHKCYKQMCEANFDWETCPACKGFFLLADIMANKKFRASVMALRTQRQAPPAQYESSFLRCCDRAVPVLTSQCESCLTQYCDKCHGRLEPEQNPRVPHECVPLHVETVNTVRDSCKPCPKCRVPIQRSEGCSHMFCVVCKFSFCWETGRELQHSTNPLYAQHIAQYTEMVVHPLEHSWLYQYIPRLIVDLIHFARLYDGHAYQFLPERCIIFAARHMNILLNRNLRELVLEPVNAQIYETLDLLLRHRNAACEWAAARNAQLRAALATRFNATTTTQALIDANMAFLQTNISLPVLFGHNLSLLLLVSEDQSAADHFSSAFICPTTLETDAVIVRRFHCYLTHFRVHVAKAIRSLFIFFQTALRSFRSHMLPYFRTFNLTCNSFNEYGRFGQRIREGELTDRRLNTTEFPRCFWVLDMQNNPKRPVDEAAYFFAYLFGLSYTALEFVARVVTASGTTRICSAPIMTMKWQAPEQAPDTILYDRFVKGEFRLVEVPRGQIPPTHGEAACVVVRNKPC